MKNPFEKMFKKPEEKIEYTGETKLTADSEGSIVSEETAKKDAEFDKNN